MIMKRILFILALVMGAAVGMAQEILATVDNEEGVLIERIGNTYYYNNLAMDKKECAAFLAENSIPIYREFHSGYMLQKKGWWLLGAGVGLEVVGTALTVAAMFAYNDVAIATMLGVGITSLVVGAGCGVASIPVLAIGYTRMHDSVDYYNIKQKAKQRSLNLSLNASQNGIGLALNF